MKERPILFSAPMVLAILAGTKRQTRRIVQSPARNMQRAGDQVISYRPPGDRWYGDHVWSMRDREGVWGDYTHEEFLAFCPYGKPGDRLWVRETWSDLATGMYPCPRAWYRSDGSFEHLSRTTHERHCGFEKTGTRHADCLACYPEFRWKPSIFMPRWASRLTLEIESVRVERLQSISEEDAKAEGCDWHERTVRDSAGELITRSYRAGFQELWTAINGGRPGASWADSPWVWAISFKRIEVSP